MTRRQASIASLLRPQCERNTEQLRGEVAEVIELVSARASRCRPVRWFAGVNGGRFASLQARIDACRCLFERKNDEPPKFVRGHRAARYGNPSIARRGRLAHWAPRFRTFQACPKDLPVS